MELHRSIIAADYSVQIEMNSFWAAHTKQSLKQSSECKTFCFEPESTIFIDFSRGWHFMANLVRFCLNVLLVSSKSSWNYHYKSHQAKIHEDKYFHCSGIIFNYIQLQYFPMYTWTLLELKIQHITLKYCEIKQTVYNWGWSDCCFAEVKFLCYFFSLCGSYWGIFNRSSVTDV